MALRAKSPRVPDDKGTDGAPILSRSTIGETELAMEGVGEPRTSPGFRGFIRVL